MAESLLDSVLPESAEEIDRAWNDEALRRATDVERGAAETLDGDDALHDLQEKLRRVRRV